MRTELERTTPSAVGLSASAIDEYIRSLEKCGTEMHGIMISRYNKVCAEGWWKPFSPRLRHGLQSLTKAYTGTAVGLLIGEGKIRLEDKVCDLLPEFMPEEISENLKLLTIHDMLCMGSGLETMQDRTKETWVQDFFASPFVNRPGDKFFYSGLVTSILGVVIRKITGQGLMSYLKPRLFDKIGIIADELKWIEHPDGMEYGGGGLLSTTEDNLRLGLLYLNDGVWNDEHLLTADWIKKATAKQIDSIGEGPADNEVGYGYQIWMCQLQGVYRFDGAAGQFVIMVPSLSMVISINQFAWGPTVQQTLDLTWEYLLKAEGKDDDMVLQRLNSLSLPAVKTAPVPAAAQQLYNKTYDLEPNEIYLLPGVYSALSHKLPKGIEKITVIPGSGEIILNIRYGEEDHVLHVSMDGVERLSKIHVAHDLPDMVYSTGCWESDGQLHMELHYIETCYKVRFKIRPVEKGLVLTSYVATPFTPDSGQEVIINASENGEITDKITVEIP